MDLLKNLQTNLFYVPRLPQSPNILLFIALFTFIMFFRRGDKSLNEIVL